MKMGHIMRVHWQINMQLSGKHSKTIPTSSSGFVQALDYAHKLYNDISSIM